MKKTILFLILSLTLYFPSNLFSGDIVVPEQKLIGIDEPSPLGELVEISVSQIKNPPTNLVLTKYKWNVKDPLTGKDKKIRADENGGIYFGSGIKDKQKLEVTLIITHLFGTKNPDGSLKDWDVITTVLKADIWMGSKPGPTPDPPVPPTPPEPNPNDEPVFVDGKYKLAKQSYELVKTQVAQDKDNSKVITGFVLNYKLNSDALKNGKFKTVQESLLKVRADNDKLLTDLGVDRNKWLNFFNALADIMFALYQSNKMVTLNDFAIAFSEIAEGLSKVK